MQWMESKWNWKLNCSFCVPIVKPYCLVWFTWRDIFLFYLVAIIDLIFIFLYEYLIFCIIFNISYSKSANCFFFLLLLSFWCFPVISSVLITFFCCCCKQNSDSEWGSVDMVDVLSTSWLFLMLYALMICSYFWPLCTGRFRLGLNNVECEALTVLYC